MYYLFGRHVARNNILYMCRGICMPACMYVQAYRYMHAFMQFCLHPSIYTLLDSSFYISLYVCKYINVMWEILFTSSKLLPVHQLHPYCQHIFSAVWSISIHTYIYTLLNIYRERKSVCVCVITLLLCDRDSVSSSNF